MNIASLEEKLEATTGSNWTLGVSTLISPDDPVKGVNEILETNVGFQRIEVALAKQPGDKERCVNQLTELRREHNLRYSVHTPFLYDDLAHPKEDVRKINVNEGRKAIDLAARIGARHTVFHPGDLYYRRNLPSLEVFEPFRKPREEYLKNSLQSLTTLAEHASSHGVVPLIENLSPGLCDRPEEVRYLLSRLDNSKFLLDIGHANISGTLEELLELNPQYFHFHDNDGEGDDHSPLGEGTIDPSKLTNRLRDYKGERTIIFELYSLEDVLISLEVLEESLEG
ncbi:MAG: sugar phosphate isomerase/epimerase family protein [Candidatus Bipolaricaulota bacterium]|nr:sugar phosphate isomerase/epimerase [Candidatus Bipolaricaulota bacterium]